MQKTGCRANPVLVMTSIMFLSVVYHAYLRYMLSGTTLSYRSKYSMMLSWLALTLSSVIHHGKVFGNVDFHSMVTMSVVLMTTRI